MATETGVSGQDRSLARRCIAGGAVLMLLGVAFGAFGAHGLQGSLTPKQMASFQTGVTYQQVHALGLILVGVIAAVMPPTQWLQRSAMLLLAGVLLFCGAIYALTFGAPRWFGMIAPLGGTSFMLGWGALAMHAWTLRSPRDGAA